MGMGTDSVIPVTTGERGCMDIDDLRGKIVAHREQVPRALLTVTDSVIQVTTDERGCMDIDDLRGKIVAHREQGHLPVAVLATAGTTVLGAFDDLQRISAVCQENNMWMHVDACWGGGVLFSQNHRNLLSGIEGADSLCISLHKMMGAPLQCVLLLVKHKGLLQECFGQQANYMFQQDKCYDVSFDLGDMTVQCGRKADALKFSLMWKARGDEGMATHVDSAFEKAQYTDKIRNNEGFELVMPEFQCVNICFWYIPKRLRGKERTKEWRREINQVAPAITRPMQTEGTMLIGYKPLVTKNLVNFFRIILINYHTTHKDLDGVLELIDQYGRDH